MLIPASDFGSSGITRLFCDACLNLCVICYKGNKGDYCSKACLDQTEGPHHSLRDYRTPTVRIELDGAEKVKITPPETVQTKVKIIQAEKVKTHQKPKVKTLTRNQRGILRRAAVRQIRRDILSDTGREPTIAQVQARLTSLGLGASVRTVWKDLTDSA